MFLYGSVFTNFFLVHPLTNFFLCFSLIKNTRAIFDTKLPDGVITSVNGIRTISMMWVILGHVWSVCISYSGEWHLVPYNPAIACILYTNVKEKNWVSSNIFSLQIKMTFLYLYIYLLRDKDKINREMTEMTVSAGKHDNFRTYIV